jgi:Fe-S-cluster-containing dehydrogenase component/CRP-like cAMP-binding protein
MSDADVDAILALALFRTIDESGFPATLPLRGIIRNDTRRQSYRKGDVIVREGDYGSSAFVSIRGAVAVAVDHKAPPVPVGSTRKPRSWFSALAQLWRNPKMIEVRDVRLYEGQTVERRGTASSDVRVVIPDVDAYCRAHRVERIEQGGFFGEIAALSRTPRTATVFAIEDCELLEIRWQGLRDIRRRDKAFRQYIDGLYRSRSLKIHLAEYRLFRNLPEEVAREIAAGTLFETYGEFEWYSTFKRHIWEEEAHTIFEEEPVIAKQGDYVDGLLLIRSGFARLSESLGQGQRTLRFITKNDVVGMDEIIAHWRDRTPLILRHTVTAIGYVDVLRVPTALVERYILPLLDAGRDQPGAAVRFAGASDAGEQLDPELVNFLVDHRVINGTQTMMIDTDRCVGCDDCVRACAATHDNNPRFVRHGPQHGKLMIANACMHCRDPVCLIGCPTGAINRPSIDGRVLINDATCIGCGTCAASCPYNNIHLVEIRDAEGAFIIDEATNAPIVKATKCDLCLDQLGGPACQRACPHDALIRIDMSDHAAVARWVNR